MSASDRPPNFGRGNMGKQLEAAIEKVIREDFPDAKLLAVKIKEDEGFDGDPILRITVIFQTTHGFDPKRAAGIVRRIRPALRENEVDAFPVFSFMSKKDARIAGALQ